MNGQDCVVIGGGAAGFFAAIACAEAMPGGRVRLLEATRRPLSKVALSGGGRCNVTHNCFDVRELCTHYPRGYRELRGPFSRFAARDTVAWFEGRGVPLKTEADGRMFSITDSSQTIIDCLHKAAAAAKVELHRGCKVTALEVRAGGGFRIHCGSAAEVVEADKVLCASGSMPLGYELAAKLGHSIVDPVPSLFTFKVPDRELHALAGVSVGDVHLSLRCHGHKKNFEQRGPLLVTHWGLSGPAVLKLSAWAARELHASGYAAQLLVNWLPGRSEADLLEELQAWARDPAKSRKTVALASPGFLPKRLWAYLVTHLKLPAELAWGQCGKAKLRELAKAITAFPLPVAGKGIFKEEFVTAGGIALREVNFKSMESKLVRGLYFAGEILDIDGVTGGFNFQNAWTTGWIAGHAMAESA